MAYKNATASSDGVNIDVHFGAAQSFLIYEVNDKGEFSFLEKRDYDEAREGESIDGKPAKTAGCHGSGSGCGLGGCSGGASAKVELISDVRAVIAEKIGFNVQKQLEKIDKEIDEARAKITDSSVKREKLEGQIGILNEKIKSATDNDAHFRKREKDEREKLEARYAERDKYLEEKEAIDKEAEINDYFDIIK